MKQAWCLTANAVATAEASDWILWPPLGNRVRAGRDTKDLRFGMGMGVRCTSNRRSGVIGYG